jgi:hypothetical protein
MTHTDQIKLRESCTSCCRVNTNALRSTKLAESETLKRQHSYISADMSGMTDGVLGGFDALACLVLE